MQTIRTIPGLADQVYQLVLDEICDGKLAPGAHLVQEKLAERYGVSRQPIQQAMALLKADGLVEEAGKRGLFVATLDLNLMHHHYQIRSALDVLAAKLAAQRMSRDKTLAQQMMKRGRAILDKGENARGKNQVREQIRHDEDFHYLIYEQSGNPLLQITAENHWRYLRRVMSDVLRQSSAPRVIWQQHREILEAVVSGDVRAATRLAQNHIENAADTLSETFKKADPAEKDEMLVAKD